MNLKPAYFSLIIFSLLFVRNVHSAEFAISPMMIELDMLPGETQTFEFNIHGKTEGTAAISFNEMKQEASGYMFFSEPTMDEGDNHALSSWTKVSSSSVKVKKGETKTVTGEIKLPRSAKGNYLLAVMVEDQKEKGASGVSLNVRYAIVINVRTPVKSKRLKSEFKNLAIEEQNGNYFVSAWFTNESLRDSYLESSVMLRNEDNRLVAEIPLLTKSAWQRQDPASRVFPNSEVKVYGLLPPEIKNGNYKLIAKNRFGNKPMQSSRAEVSLARENPVQEKESKKDIEQGIVRIHPSPIPLKANSRSKTFSLFTVSNTNDQPVAISLPENAENEHVQYRFSPNKLELAPGESKMITLKQSFKNGLVEQSFKAKIETTENKQYWIDFNTRI